MKKTPKKPKFELNADQQNAVNWMLGGYNVFLTGVAGTGKSVAVNHYLAQVPEDHYVGIAASTGIAATHIGGITLHSWIGATPEKDTVSRLCNGFWRKKHGDRLRAVRTLIIDEISMVDAQMFTLAEACHRAVRDSDQPWGGVQVILVGDLGQLPPVEAEEKGWCFQSPKWEESRIQTLELTKVMRQEEQRFANILRRIRVGVVDQEVLATLGSRVRAFDPNGPGVVRLMTHNDQADRVNEEKLAQVGGETFTFNSVDRGEEPYLSQLQKTCLSPATLGLKLGARVMFTKNDTETGQWVNGSLGEVVKVHAKDCIEVKLNNGETVVTYPVTWERKMWGHGGTLRVVAARTQFPLRLAWAITIHKSQGMTLDRVSMNLADVFAPGQAYVALSRCRTLEGINIEGWRGAETIVAHPMLRASVAS